MAAVVPLDEFVRRMRVASEEGARLEQTEASLEEKVKMLIRDLRYFSTTSYADEIAGTKKKMLTIEERIDAATRDERHRVEVLMSLISNILHLLQNAKLAEISREANEELRNLIEQQGLITRIEQELRNERELDPQTLERNVELLKRLMNQAKDLFRDIDSRAGGLAA